MTRISLINISESLGNGDSFYVYNEIARLLLIILQRDVGMDERFSAQQLDDNPLAYKKG